MLNTRAEETTQSVGTGSLLLDGAPTGRIRLVEAVGSGKAGYFTVETQDGAQWEDFWGVVTAGAPDTVTRNVIRSSNGDAPVDFGAGTKRVYCNPNGDAVRFGAVGDVPQAAGTASHLTLSFAPPLKHLRNGMRFSFVTASACPGATDLAINGFAAYPIVNIHDGSNTVLNQWRANQILQVIYFNGIFALLTIAAKAVLDDVEITGISLLSAASGTGLVLIDRKVAAASSSLDFTNIPSVYDNYMLELTNIVPATAAVDLQLSVSDDNGSTYKSANYHWATYVVTEGATSGPAGSSSASSIKIAPNLANYGGIGLSGSIRMKGLGTGGVYKHMIIDTAYYDNTAAYKRGMGSGQYTGNSNAINALRLTCSSGNIATGIATLYGLRAS